MADRSPYAATLALAVIVACAKGTPPGDAPGEVTPSGSAPPTGTLSALRFAVVGDTRPATPDDLAGYPTAIISAIYGDIGASSPPPAFVISTGDYQFSSGGGASAAAQLDLYVAARSAFSGPLYAALGNHECTGATASNCGPSGKDGTTPAYEAFLAKLLAPAGQTSPYYSVSFAAEDGGWTAKVVIVAANAWSSDQASWLTSVLGEPTTYTFIVRHEPAAEKHAPGVAPSEAIMAGFPFTLAIVGHSHTFRRSGDREIIVGNGGAPLSGDARYGYGLVSRKSDGNVQVEMIDYESGASSQGFRVAPNGAPVP